MDYLSLEATLTHHMGKSRLGSWPLRKTGKVRLTPHGKQVIRGGIRKSPGCSLPPGRSGRPNARGKVSKRDRKEGSPAPAPAPAPAFPFVLARAGSSILHCNGELHPAIIGQPRKQWGLCTPFQSHPLSAGSRALYPIVACLASFGL